MIASSLAELLRQYFNMDQLTSEIVASAIVFGLIVFIGWIACLIFRKYLTKWAEKTKTKLDDEILRSTKAPVLLLAILVGAYYSLESLTFLDPYSELFTAIFTIAEILAITFIITRVTNVLVSWYAARAKLRRLLFPSFHIFARMRRRAPEGF